MRVEVVAAGESTICFASAPFPLESAIAGI